MSHNPYDPIDMKSLLCFATMVRHGSITRASIELDISSAAVSQQIRKLEAHLGQKLYEARGGKVRLTFDAPSRGLIGYHGEFLTDTRGTGIMNRSYDRYDAYKGPIAGRQRGVLIANAGAYGYVMSSRYNLRDIPPEIAI